MLIAFAHEHKQRSPLAPDAFAIPPRQSRALEQAGEASKIPAARGTSQDRAALPSTAELSPGCGTAGTCHNLTFVSAHQNLATPVHSPHRSFTSIFPKFSPLNNLRKAVGAFSMPCSMVSFHVILPSCIHPDISLSLELGHVIEIVRDVEPFQPKALAHDEHDVTWSAGQPCGIVL